MDPEFVRQSSGGEAPTYLSPEKQRSMDQQMMFGTISSQYKQRNDDSRMASKIFYMKSKMSATYILTLKVW
jgi:hypothetical protein